MSKHSDKSKSPVAGRPTPVPTWYQRNRGDLKFLLVFGVCMAVYYAVSITAPVRDGFIPAYLRLNASVSGAILRTMSEDVTVDGQAIISAAGPSITVARGCDAIVPSALFVSAVLASPVALASRLGAAVAGTLFLMLLNLVRVVSLYLVRVHWPAAFDTMHLDVWQVLFIFLALAIWMIWASRAARQGATASDAPS